MPYSLRQLLANAAIAAAPVITFVGGLAALHLKEW
jgi:hypothetical protein